MTTSQEKGKEKGMTFMYSATLGNQYNRGTILMGHDATMELGNSMIIYADPRSTRYADWLKDGTATADVPLYSYDPRAKGLDGVTSATAKYFADKGLLFTYRDGKRVDSTHLHMREWSSCIRLINLFDFDSEQGLSNLGTMRLHDVEHVDHYPAT